MLRKTIGVVSVGVLLTSVAPASAQHHVEASATFNGGMSDGVSGDARACLQLHG
jgi:hypothetical protein